MCEGDCKPVLPGEMDQTTVHLPSLAQSHNLWPHVIEIFEHLVYLMLNLLRASSTQYRKYPIDNMKIFVNIIFVVTMQLQKLRKFCNTKIWSHTVVVLTLQRIP